MRAARRIEQGQYETAVSVAGGDEFRRLAATFNAMQSNIAAREADITYQAYHDPLTQLPNRALVMRGLESLVSGVARAASTALMLIELRNLRDINASLGHQVGDDVLREAARRLQQNVAAVDTLARLGETQFLVIAPGCSAERALLYAEQLAAVIRTGFHLAGVSLDLRVACGVCLFPSHGRSANELLQRAQVALDDADEVRTRVAMYRLGQDEEHRRRLALITDLRAAIDENAPDARLPAEGDDGGPLGVESRGAGALAASAARRGVAGGVRAAGREYRRLAAPHQLGAGARPCASSASGAARGSSWSWR